MLLIGIHGNWLHQADHKQTDLEPTNLNWLRRVVIEIIYYPQNYLA